MKPLKILNISLLLFEVFLCIGGFIGYQVVFGHGLGDLLYYIVLYILTIIHSIWTYKVNKVHQHKFITPIVLFSITTLLFCLKATIWRGPEYSWKNRKLFYESKRGVPYIDSTQVRAKSAGNNRIATMQVKCYLYAVNYYRTTEQG